MLKAAIAPKHQWLSTDYAANAADVVGHGGEVEENTSFGFYMSSVPVNVTG